MYSHTQIDPMVGFRNSQGESARGMIVNLQRKSLVMEVYNPYSIVQVSEMLSDLIVRLATKSAVYTGMAVVTNIVNTGLTAIVSVTLIDEWRELSALLSAPGMIGAEARAFAKSWPERFQIRRDYQIIVNEMSTFLSDVARWVGQVDLSDSLPKEDGRLREDYFFELATPLIETTKSYLNRLEHEASLVDDELAPVHRAFAQSSLHPLLLRAPFVFRTYMKPLGYAGDYEMVNQIIDDPRQGPNTYFQIVNATFLRASVAIAHRNRIDILIDFLKRTADAARKVGRNFKILNVGCGPAIEIQRFLQCYPHPEVLSFELVDFSEETLAWTREKLAAIMESTGKRIDINYVHDSVHQLLKRRIDAPPADLRKFDAVYCAGLFDYLSDKVCSRLMMHFATRIVAGGKLLITNVHSCNPERLFVMEHLLEWYLIYRNETRIDSILPKNAHERRIYVDETGVNLFAEMALDEPMGHD